MRGIKTLWALAAASVLAGCAGIAGTGAGKQMAGYENPVNIIDTQRLHQMDRTMVQDLALIGYVEDIRKRLEQAHGKPCDCVVLVDSFGGYEAYSLSHKTLVLSAGLLAQAESEDEVAAILAHEMGHAYEGDNIKGFLQDASLYMAKAGGFALGQGGYTMMLGEYVDDAAKGLIYRQWNTGQESEADLFAMNLLAKAGYSIDGLKMAIRRLSEYGAQVNAARPATAGECVKSEGRKTSLNLKACSKQLTGVEQSIYQDRDERLKAIVVAARQLDPEDRRRRAGPRPPTFASIDYLFSMNSLVSNNAATLKRNLARLERRPIPSTLAGNVAVSNKLAAAYAMTGNKAKAAAYLTQSFESRPRTAWTFNALYKQVDRRGDAREVEKVIQEAHEEVGLMPALLPVEGYLAERHKLFTAHLFSMSRCLMTMVDDQKTLNLCDQFSKQAQSGRLADW
ncbi:M48 family metalloprotease [Pusillimonas sp. SM2304]|uniref:M48 family metalloprotease n=1 Tax=Pusillimonas sp. SM2304 TaxID=3073241 RepID=UPI00287419E1|nr:M48 family metalloprotease [Pusillimonas sp. SM2304]MDS1139764.1 M48 family metalloprotease [Pusillimonas sp. SM2304]